MTIDLTAARPYAKAIFALALRDRQFYEWQNALNTLATVTTECKKRFLLNNPRVGRKQELEFFSGTSEDFPVAYNLVRVLAERKNIGILPDIAASYKQLLFEHEKILEAKVVTACELSTVQKEQLVKALQERTQHQILLQCQIDTTLIGGAVVYVDGQVIDGSIKGMLQRLKQSL
ncbi:ATP synthase subunit delta [Gammaproteobacteria bacterium]